MYNNMKKKSSCTMLFQNEPIFINSRLFVYAPKGWKTICRQYRDHFLGGVQGGFHGLHAYKCVVEFSTEFT